MPVAEITRTETSERARLIRVESYDVWLDLTGGSEVFGSTSVIRFNCASPGASTYIDLVALTVSEITLNGAPVDVGNAYAAGRIALQGLTAINELRVVADCGYTSDGTGMHRAVDSADGKTYLYTNFEPADARKVFANFEQPDLKAEFTFHVTAPAHWSVISNQPAPEPVAVDRGDAGPGASAAAVWHFPATPRISGYVTAIVAGEYVRVSDSHITPGGQTIPLGVACRASLAEHLDAEEIFHVARQGLDYYERLFGTGYPFAKYDQVFVPEFSAGAMENVGCVVISEQLLFRSRVTDTMRELRTIVILHEMAHMWFGDLVTMRWWDDLWLNESFAEFCAYQATSEATRFREAWTTFASGRKTWAYRQDRMPTTHPISADVETLTEATANFDGISYAKGAAVLKQLVAYVGRDRFFSAVNSYFAEHAFGNAALGDLMSALATQAERDLADWSKAWLETAGPNVLRPEFTVGADGSFREFAVAQEASAECPTLRPHHVAIGLYRMTDGVLTRTSRIETDLAGPRTEVPELVGFAQPELVLVNDDDLGYAIVRFDQRSLDTLTRSIGDFAASLPRAVCWTAAVDMVMQAELAVPSFVHMLARGMAAEPLVSVLQTLHMVARQVITQFADPVWVRDGYAELATAAERLLRIAEPGSDHQLAWAQLLGWTAVTPDQLRLISNLLDGSAKIDGLAVDTELRWTLLRRLCAAGQASDSDVDAEVQRDPTDEGQRQASSCRAAMPDATHKADAWRLLTETAELGVQTLVEVALAFAQPDQADLLAPYVSRYLEVLPRLWGERGETLRVLLGQLLFPYPAASAAFLEQVDAKLAAVAGDPGLERVLREKRDSVARALRSRALVSS